MTRTLIYSYNGYVNRVKIADLKNNLSRHLSQVRAGGELIVLDRETPVARIVPFDRHERAAARGKAGPEEYWTKDRLADMERRGTIARGDAPAMAAWVKALRPARLPAGAPSTVDLLLRMRRETTR